MQGEAGTGEDADNSVPLRLAPIKKGKRRTAGATRPLGVALVVRPRSAAPGCRA